MNPEPISFTRGVCPVCRRLVQASIIRQGQRILLERFCPEHGKKTGLVSSSADYYLSSLVYVKPGRMPLSFARQVREGCPMDCGLCPDHEQHTCLPIIEITGRCDLDCPICLVGSSSRRRHARDLSLGDFQNIIDWLCRAEGMMDLVNLSGGEPTLHPQIREIIGLCNRPEILRTSISTNGLRLAENEPLLDFIVEKGILISLQFDGFSPDVYQSLRGAEIVTAKEKLLRKMEEKRAVHSLVVTLGKNINEKEIRAILDYFFSSDLAVSLMFQPLAHTGRCRGKNLDPLERLTIPDVIQLIAGASSGKLAASDFSPLPCSHPACFALTYMLKLDNGDLLPIPRLVPVADYLDIIKNRSIPGLDGESFARIKDCLYQLWSSSGAAPDSQKILDTVKKMIQEVCCPGREVAPRQALAVGEQHVKSIFIHHFMDEDNYDLARAVRCCNHYPLADGRLMPACTYNIFHRGH